MKIQGYNIDLENAVTKINQNNYKKIVLQIPEGLKSQSNKIVDFLEKETKAEIIISADPYFGACDLISLEYRNLDVDFVIQIGHYQLPYIKKYEIPTYFINAESSLDVTKVIKKSIPHLKGKNIGLVTTAQHIHKLNEAKEILEKNNYTVTIGKGDKRIEKEGQILGCNFSTANSIKEKIDSYLYIGSGDFHPLGLILSTKKPVIVANPYTNKIRDVELNDLKDSILRQRYGAIARSKDAKTFGILMGIKRGQQRRKETNKLKEIIRSKGKKCYVIALDYFSANALENFRDIDCFVSTACPRIAIDDYMQYKTPILTPIELEILFGIKNWNDYRFDEIINK